MRIARHRFIHLIDEHDRAAAEAAGYTITTTPLGQYGYEVEAPVVDAETREEAQRIIRDLLPRAQALRTQAKRAAA